jgi:hypothetical protein
MNRERLRERDWGEREMGERDIGSEREIEMRREGEADTEGEGEGEGERDSKTTRRERMGQKEKDSTMIEREKEIGRETKTETETEGERKREREIKRRPRPYIPFVTVVTDLASGHITWFDRRVDACYVASQELKDFAIERGKMERERVLLRGLPVRAMFWRERDRLRQKERQIDHNCETDKAAVERDRQRETKRERKRERQWEWKWPWEQEPERDRESDKQREREKCSEREKERERKALVRASLGLSGREGEKVLLVMGGGDGVGALGEIAKTVVRELRSERDRESEGESKRETDRETDRETEREGVSVIVVCGHNEKMKKELERELQAIDLSHKQRGKETERGRETGRGRETEREKVKVYVKGFVSNMNDYMEASDCLITKAGPGTIAEAMVCGLPLVISSFLPGQVSVLSVCFD